MDRLALALRHWKQQREDQYQQSHSKIWGGDVQDAHESLLGYGG